MKIWRPMPDGYYEYLVTGDRKVDPIDSGSSSACGNLFRI
jgi:hypothetical protein